MREREISVSPCQACPARSPRHLSRAAVAVSMLWSMLGCAGCGRDASPAGVAGSGGSSPTPGTDGGPGLGSGGRSGGGAGSSDTSDAGASVSTGGRPGALDASAADANRSSADGGATDVAGWKLVWADEFDVDGPPDPASWAFERGFVRNQELQWYQPGNAVVAGGILTIEGRQEQVVNPTYLAGSTDWRRNRAMSQYTSSSMTTAAKHGFTYGRFSMRARIDTRRGSWPAFWTLGAGVPWPQSGEVDIMEYYASNVLANVCKPTGGTCGWSSVLQPLSRLGAAWSADFHVWTMEWDAQKIDLYLDDALINHFNVADAVPAGQPNPYVGKSMYLLVNLALGANGGDPAATPFPIQYAVDWIRVYQRAN
jgi:beta-glucanase (GH16 family)